MTAGQAFAEDLLQPGRWTGGYRPDDIGQSVTAEFIVKRVEDADPPWAIVMRLDLDPPANAPMRFDSLQIDDDGLRFTLTMPDAKQLCVLERRPRGMLGGECSEEDAETGETAKLFMKPPAAASEPPGQGEEVVQPVVDGSAEASSQAD